MHRPRETVPFPIRPPSYVTAGIVRRREARKDRPGEGFRVEVVPGGYTERES